MSEAIPARPAGLIMVAPAGPDYAAYRELARARRGAAREARTARRAARVRTPRGRVTGQLSASVRGAP